MLPARWQIDLLGQLRVRSQTRTIERFRTHKTGALLAYLALESDRAHAREVLADTFWADSPPDAARGNLRVALNSLRRQLEPPGVATGSVLWASREQVQLRPDAISTDVAEFESTLAKAEQTAAAAAKAQLLRDAVALYRGRLLPHLYDDWALQAQDRLARSYVLALARLDSLSEADGDLNAALEFAAKRLEADPTDEAAQARVLRLRHQFDVAPVDGHHYAVRGVVPSWSGAGLAALETTKLPDGVGRVRIFGGVTGSIAVSEPDLRGVRPPGTPPIAWLAAADDMARPAVNLPIPLNRFFGRQLELLQIERLVTVGEARLITLTGPGGTGKTRLAIEAARHAQDRFTTIVFVSLAEHSVPNPVPDAVARALGLSQSTMADPLEACCHRLATGRTLLILDNFEHLLGEDDEVPGSLVFVQALLESAPELTCLVTSRRRLCLIGEQELVIPPLQISVEADPGATRDPTADILPDCQSPAVALFVNRAQAARADFQLTPRNAGSIAALCGRLDGLPLAIELAAGWAQSLTPEQMLAQVISTGSRRSTILVSRDRNAAIRHRSLQAAIMWSFSTLSADLGRFLSRLTIFQNGWTIDAAAAVCLDGSGDGVEPVMRCLQLLTALRERNLVTTEERTLGTDSYLRFRMLETVREFGDEQLADDERVAVRERHADYFLSLAETAEREMCTRDVSRWQRRLTDETEDFRKACGTFLAGGPIDNDRLARLATTLAFQWANLNRQTGYREAFAWIAELSPDHVSSRQWGRVLLARALVGRRSATYARRKEWFHDSLDVFRATDDTYGEALALAELRQPGDSFCSADERPELLRRSLRTFEEVGDKRAAARVLLALAHDDPEHLPWERDACFDRSLRLSQECGDIDGNAVVLQERGWNLYCRGKYEAAAEILHDALRFQRLHDLRDRQGATLWTLGKVLNTMGRGVEARAAYVECVRVLASIGSPDGRGTMELGEVCAEQQDLAEARFWHERARNLFGLCVVTLCQSDYPAARGYCQAFLNQALDEIRRAAADGLPMDESDHIITRWRLQTAHHYLALLDTIAGDVSGARMHLQEARAAADSATRHDTADAAAAASRCLLVLGRLALIARNARLTRQIVSAWSCAFAEASSDRVCIPEGRFQRDFAIGIQAELATMGQQDAEETITPPSWQTTLSRAYALLVG